MGLTAPRTAEVQRFTVLLKRGGNGGLHFDLIGSWLIISKDQLDRSWFIAKRGEDDVAQQGASPRVFEIIFGGLVAVS
jgi:hypothetical protein